MIKELARKIKTLRIENGLKQEELAERVGLTRDAVSKWENGKNIPRLPELMSLAKVFKISVSDLILETEKDRTSLVESIVVKDISAPKTAEYFGVAETHTGFSAYWCDYKESIEREQLEDEKDQSKSVSECLNENIFLLLINRKTKEINGIRDFGMFSPKSADYLFVSDYLPFRVSHVEGKEDLKAIGENVLANFEKEIAAAVKKAKKAGKQPLFIYDYCGTNNYIAWSFNEKKSVCVYGYKTYRKNFGVSEIYCFDLNGISVNHNYMVIVPSDQLIKDVGLALSSNSWDIKMEWDVWEKREPKSVMIHDWDLCRAHEEPYKEAILFINMSRKKNCGFDKEFAQLEKRVAAYEKLHEMKAPIIILQNEMGLLVNVMESLKDKLVVRMINNSEPAELLEFLTEKTIPVLPVSH